MFMVPWFPFCNRFLARLTESRRMQYTRTPGCCYNVRTRYTESIAGNRLKIICQKH
jgi:hypothetical protein